MAAITTTRQLHLHLHLRPIIPLPHSSLHHFSSSSSPPNPDTSESDNSNNNLRPSFSSYFSDVKATLQNNKPNPTTASLEEIRKNLSEFRARPPPPPPPPSSTGKHVTLQELYNKNLISNSDNSNPKAPSFDAIRDSLRHLRSNPNPKSTPSNIQKQFDPTSIQRFKETLKLKPEDLDSGTVIGGSQGLDFGGGDGVAMRTEFVKMYDTKELGTKLRMLRPERRKGKWFSLHELNERLARLREVEETESQGRVGGVTFKDLRETLVKLKISDDEKVKKKTCESRLFLAWSDEFV